MNRSGGKCAVKTSDGAAATRARAVRSSLAMLPPIVALALQWMLWDFFHPHVWFLFYPAVFLSSWIGGLRAGVLATAFSVVCVSWFFLAPVHSFVKPVSQYLSASVFLATGLLFGVFHDRLRRALWSSERAKQEAQGARERLQHTSESVAALLDQAPDGIFVADLDGRYVDVNRCGCELLGYSREEILGKTIADLIPDGEAERLQREREHLLAGGTEVSEWNLRRKDGTFALVEVNARILSDGRWQAVVRDISDRKRQEQELREARERLELAFRGADLATWDWNIPTGEVVFNARWGEMRGFRPEEVSGQVDTWSSGIHPEDRPRVEQALDDYFHGRIPEYAVEHRARTKSGDWIWILDKGKVFTRDERGQPSRMVGTELDITARKRAEEALRLAEAKASGILSISADAIVSIDEAERITLFNDGAEKIFGYTRAEAMGAPLAMLIPEHLRAIHDRHVRGFATGRAISRRMGERGAMISGRRKSGAEFPADAAISKLDVGGTRILTVALRDVTEQVRLQDEQKLLADVGAALASTLELQPTLTTIGELATRSLAEICILYVIEETGHVRRVAAVARDPARKSICDLLMKVPIDRSRAPELWSEMEANRSVLLDRVDPETFAQSEEHLQALRALGPSSVVMAPLFADGKLLGAMALIASAATQTYAPRDVPFVEQVAQRAALALAKARLYDAARRAIQALEESEERFSRTIDEAPIGMALVGLDGRFLRVNRVLCEIVGYTPEELTGLTFQAITHPDDLDADLALAAQLTRGEIPRYQLPKRYIRKDGTVVDILLSGSAVHGRDGAPIHFVAQIEDVTERKRLADEERFLAEVGPMLASSLDYEETITRVAGLAVRDLADLCIVELTDDDDEVRRFEATARDPAKAWIAEWLANFPIDRERPYLLREVLETRRPVLLPRLSAHEIASLAQSEDHLRVLRAAAIRSMVAVPLLAHGRLLGAIAFLSSSRPYGPADLRLAEELGRRAALSIENARLYRIAGRAKQARDDVLGIVAHDLRNPLNNIIMQVGMLRRRKCDPDRLDKGVDVIDRAATRMNRLIQDLLDVTRMEAGRLNVETAAVAADRIVLDAVEAQKSLATASALELRIDLPRELPEIWADRDRLLQVFENLLGNALKFTGRGGVVTVGARARDDDVLFWVDDTGDGIPPEDLPRLFDRFWQARKTRRLGAGLGLPIVKGLVEAHCGGIWVESTVGRGTTFFFTIPTARAIAAWRAESAPRAP